MAAAAHVLRCRTPTGVKFLGVTSSTELVPSPVQGTVTVQRLKGTGKTIVLQPRVCNLRLYGSKPVGILKSRKEGDLVEVSQFFEILSDYIDSTKKSRDFETISGRLAMILFVATVGMETVTGNSLFQKMDVQGITEAAGACLGAVGCAAAFAWFSSARSKVGRIFTAGCNTLIDSLIDQIVDGLFYESELSYWPTDEN